MNKWLNKNIPDLTGQTAIVTGGSSGLGFFTAKGLAARGANVIIASHNAEKGLEAINKIKKDFPECKISFEKLDLADKNSIADFASKIKKQFKKLDILVCNAGIMMPKDRQLTNYGVESQFGVNYLGHFMLTNQLLPLLKTAKGRVATVSSMANNPKKFDLDDTITKNKYYPFRLYSLSKLASLMFALELDRRSKQNNWGISAVPIHPGLVRTKLFSHSSHPFVVFSFIGAKIPIIGMSSAYASRILLFAVASKKAKSGVYYGPLLYLMGSVRKAKISKQAQDLKKRQELWRFSEKVTKQLF